MSNSIFISHVYIMLCIIKVCKQFVLNKLTWNKIRLGNVLSNSDQLFKIRMTNMKSKIVVFFTIALLLIVSVFPTLAQDHNMRTIQVVGLGTAFGAPDMATVEVGVDVPDSDFGTAFDSANAIMATVLAEISALDIPSEDIQTTSINVWFEDKYNPQTGMPNGERDYHISQSLRVMVRDIEMISEVISTAVDNGANQIYGLNFSFSDTASLESTAREMAVVDAKVKAEHLAELMNVELGEVVTVVDFGTNGAGSLMGGGVMYDRVESMSVAPGQLSVGANLQITFAIQ
jgi:uncharacterized protein